MKKPVKVKNITGSDFVNFFVSTSIKGISNRPLILVKEESNPAKPDATS